MMGLRTIAALLKLALLLLHRPRASRSFTASPPTSSPLSTEVHLISVLRPDYKRTDASVADHRRFWAWKLDVLGLAMTERDYRRLRLSERVVALQPGIIREAIVIANCKRIEIVVAADAAADAASLTGRVAAALGGWASAWEEEKRNGVPGATGLDADIASEEEADDGVARFVVPDYIAARSGAEAVSRYLCRVSAGIPPEAPLHVFSPYLSRDAHVLKQLKQAFAAAAAWSSSSSSSSPPSGGGGSGASAALPSPAAPPPCRGLLGALLRGCLEAGKAARDPGTVRELSALRPSLKPSREERTRAAEAACRRAVEPAVARSVAAFAAVDRGRLICDLRERARCVAETVARECGDFDALREIQRGCLSLEVRRELHEPMLELRKGCSIDERVVMDRVAKAAVSHVKPAI